MVKLLALTPCVGLLPLQVGDVSLTEVIVEQMFSVSPLAGKNRSVSAKLKDQIGTGLTPVNRAVTKGVASVQWFGHDSWMVRAPVSPDGLAAVTDQSDAWAIVRIEGAGVEDVLARLVPIDLRIGTFRKGHTARTMLGHMSVAVTRVSRDAFEIMAMRSMAATLVHELEVALRGVAARSNF